MTEPAQPTITEPPTVTDPAATPAEPVVEPTDGRDEPATGQRAAREAAKYRTQLRETEAERDTLRSELDVYRTREVTRLASDSGLIEPEDLLKHTDLRALLDDGSVSPDLVSSAIAELRASRPQWFSDYLENTRPPSNRPIESLHPGATPRGTTTEQTTWGSFLTDAVKHRSPMQ